MVRFGDLRVMKSSSSLRLLGRAAMCAFWLGATVSAHAADPQFGVAAVARPAEAPAELPLYPDAKGGQGTSGAEIWDRLSTPDGTSGYIVRDVTQPTYSAFLPDPTKATGAAVILAPGGAFLSLSMETEGWQAARWLADHGVAAFVLKYRLNPTPSDTGAFMATVGATMKAAAEAGPGKVPEVRDSYALLDGQQMVRVLRHDAARWRIDPHRIGFVGFSAGAMTALSVTLADEPASRPDFVGFIYPPMASVAVPADAPQAFVGLASNDMLFGHAGFGLIQAWRDAERPIEFHYYEAGDHGFGMRRLGTTSDHWIDEFYWWMQARHLLDPAKTASAN
jgi:acetyl esterase/lipase